MTKKAERPDVRRALRLLILKKLGDKENFLRALYDFYIYGDHFSIVASRHKVSKIALRGFVYRLKAFLLNDDYVREIVKASVPAILEKTPKIVQKEKETVFICLLCNKRFYRMYPEDHVRKKHKNVVEKSYREIVSELKKEMIEVR
jgi:hypothetical protein